jgi:phosphate transport system permease protein
MASLAKISIPNERVLSARDSSRETKSTLSGYSLAIVTFLTALLIIGIIGTIVWKGTPSLTWEFLTQPPKENMSAGGIWPMIRGSLLLMGGTLLAVLPAGILGGVFLAEYAGRGRFAKLMHACVTSLAGTPSIVFGLFGLAVFVLLLKWKFCLLAGWLTLGVFSLPTVVLTTETAIRAVPDSLIEGALSLGLSKWQTMWKVVLPNAMPGILSGLILTTGRAAGEAPPILLTAGIYYSTSKFEFNSGILFQPIENLPYHLAEGYRQGGVIPDRIVWGTCLSLMLFVLLLNIGAVILRSRMRWKQLQH